MRVGEVVDAFGSDLTAGLDEREARRRLERDGPNVLPDRPPPSLFALLARQFTDAMVLLLLVAAVSFVIGENLDGAIILAIVVVNAASPSCCGGHKRTETTAATNEYGAVFSAHSRATRRLTLTGRR